MKYFKKLESDRIYLSPASVDDVEIYTRWMNSFDVTDKIGSSNSLFSLLSEKEYLERKIDENNKSFSIIKKEDDSLLGNCSIFDINYLHQTATLGIFIGEDNERNKGYGSEAIRLLLDFGFNYLNLNNIMLKVFSFNEKAISCYEKIGFKKIGRKREAYYLNNQRYDEIYMDILKEEYFKTKF